MLDRPISSTLSSRDNAPLPHEKVCVYDWGEPESDYGSLDGEAVIPRPLGGCLASYRTGELKLPKLRHLYLGQPTESVYGSMDYGWSSRAETACYEDWLKILQACIGTIGTLVLEQRPAADYIERDGYSEHDWMTQCVNSDACQKLFDMIETVMDGNESGTPLSQVYMYGIAAGSYHRGVECEARLGQWCFFDKYEGTADWWSCWNGASDPEDDEVEEDVTPDKKWDDVLLKV
ncbi:hypothetical protein F53441_12431 [Fusarium austroafricanum]|uniref:Uncharacterized protein n=1 Tax=Fusarium austroafricanum TaxID=2364996 RepID=A0A8H4JVQ3_9HYPO|nr:hypothetical protein F53441_12431 [Fusarium austroafricanum]